MINLQDFDVFLKRSFQVKPQLLKYELHESLVDWDDINRLLEKDIIDYPRIRLANNNNELARGYKGFVSHTLSVTGEKSPHVNRYRLYKALQDESTLIIDRCQAYFPKVESLVEQFSRLLKCRASANLYATWASTPSFGVHFDNHDVIAIQIEGSKLWEIQHPTHPYPMLSEKSFDFEPPLGAPDFKMVTEPGQAIYVPAGYWHNVKSQSERSLHISFPIIRPRKIDVIKTFLDTLVRYDEMRMPISFAPDSNERSELQHILQSCATEIDLKLWEEALLEDTMKKNFVHFDLPSIRTKYDR
ncbi:JmjC domain-containing protein [Vibrio mediterranei]